MGMNVERGLAVIFSLEEGNVWASRLDGRPPILLGPHDEVVEAMDEFIRQDDFAERLLNMAAKYGSALE